MTCLSFDSLPCETAYSHRFHGFTALNAVLKHKTRLRGFSLSVGVRAGGLHISDRGFNPVYNSLEDLEIAVADLVPGETFHTVAEGFGVPGAAEGLAQALGKGGGVFCG